MLRSLRLFQCQLEQLSGPALLGFPVVFCFFVSADVRQRGCLAAVELVGGKFSTSDA